MKTDKLATHSSIIPPSPVTKNTKYFTIKGKEDYLLEIEELDNIKAKGEFSVDNKSDTEKEKGYPCQLIENKFTYAKETGQRKLVRIDKTGAMFNPDSLYVQNLDTERWLQVSDECFRQYVMFLRSRNPLFFRHAERLMR